MPKSVTIKSYNKGLKIYLDSQCPIQTIYDAIVDKMTEAGSFFKGSTLAVSFEGRELTEDEEQHLVYLLETNSGMSISYIVGKEDETSEFFAKVANHPTRGITDIGEFGKFYTGNIKQNERIEIDRGVVILGDVEPGATIIAKGNIVILGSLFGNAICDIANEPDKYFIAAMYMSPEKIKIGDFKYIPKEKGKWLIKPKTMPKIAYLENESLMVETVSNELLKKLTMIINR